MMEVCSSHPSLGWCGVSAEYSFSDSRSPEYLALPYFESAMMIGAVCELRGRSHHVWRMGILIFRRRKMTPYLGSGVSVDIQKIELIIASAYLDSYGGADFFLGRYGHFRHRVKNKYRHLSGPEIFLKPIKIA